MISFFWVMMAFIIGLGFGYERGLAHEVKTLKRLQSHFDKIKKEA
jgi:hypothetical protein